jgi:zinc transporter 2
MVDDLDEKDVNDKSKDIVKSKMIKVSLMCLILISLEITGGLWASSLAIISDAAHMLSDLSGFMISLLSIHLA